MPNWVYNWVGVSGKTEDVKAFVEKAGKPYDTFHQTWDATTKGLVSVEATHTEPFSFWNFIEPEDKVAYHGDAHGEKPEGYEDWTAEQKLEHDLKFQGNGWYDWNVRNWGTKWDASDPSVGELTIQGDTASVSINFSTAWSIPEPVFRAMVEQHPELDFDFESEEEQGWGAEFTSSDGDEDGERSLIMTKEWDIPNSHADYVDRDKEDSCACQWNDNEEEWYDDCPDKNKEFAVSVTYTYLVKAVDENFAKNLVMSNLTAPTFKSPDIDKAFFSEESVEVRRLETQEA